MYLHCVRALSQDRDVTLTLRIHLRKLKSLQSSWALGYLLSCQDQAADENCDQRKNCASPKNVSSGESSLKAASGANKRESEVQVSSRRQEARGEVAGCCLRWEERRVASSCN